MAARLLVDIPMVNWAYTYNLIPEKQHLAGSASSNDIKLPPGVAAHSHAMFIPKEGKWFLRDDSGNGTLVNGKAVKESMLKHGDILRIGKCELVFQQPQERVEEWNRTKALLAEREFELRDALAKGSDASLALEDLGISSSQLRSSYVPTPAAPVGIETPPMAQTDLVWVAQKLAAILAEVLSQPGSRDDVFRVMLQRLRETIGADNGFVMLVDPEVNRWIIRAYSGDVGAWTSYEKEHPIPMTVANRAYEKMRVVSNAMADADEDEEDLTPSQSMLVLNVQSYIAVPLIEQGHRRGVLYFDTRNPAKEFSPRDVKLLERTGGYILEIEDQKI